MSHWQAFEVKGGLGGGGGGVPFHPMCVTILVSF